MEINKKASLPTWKLALIGAGTSVGIAVVGLGSWYLSTKVLPEISSSSGSKKSSDGLFRINDSDSNSGSGKFGHIDKTGKVVISPQFEFNKPEFNGQFHDGLARIKVGNNTGYIDKEGKVAINPQFSYAFNFYEGVAVAKIGSKWGVIDKAGKVVVNPQFDDAGPYFSEGLSPVRIGEKVGYIDKVGKIVIPPIFYGALPFEDGMAPIQSKKDGKWGYIDKAGKILIEPKFDRVWNFSEGMASVKIGEKWGYIDKTGKIAIPTRFTETSVAIGSLISSSVSSRSQGEGAFSEGIAAVIEGGKKFYIDNTGKTVIGFQIDEHSKFSEELAYVKIGDKCGYIDKAGKIVINPQFKECSHFSQGLAAVSTDDVTGYIDKSGKYIWQRSDVKSQGAE